MQTNRKRIFPLVLAIVVVFFQAAPMRAEGPAETPTAAKTIDLGIRDVIVMALEANLDIKVERYNPQIASADVMTQRGEFDPTLGFEYSYESDETPQTTSQGLASNAGTTDTVAKDVTLTAEGKLTPGTEYGITFDRLQSQFTQRDTLVDPDPFVTGDEYFTDIRNPAEYDLNLMFTLTQPLLKDFGREVNTTDIRIARVSREMSVEDFRKRVMDVIADAQNAYWDLTAAIRNVQVRERSLATAEDLLKENRIRLEVGTMAPLEVVQAETGVAQREEELIVARSIVKDAEDNLKRILNLPKDTEEWHTGINPTDIPDFVERDIDLLAELEKAFEKRPDYQKSLMQIESDAINERFNKNQLLPTVDANGLLQYLAVDDDLGDAFDDIVDGKAQSWQLGVTAEYPLRNRTAKGEYRKAQLEKQQSEKESENLRLSIIVEVNKAVRDIRTNLKQIEVTTKSVELAEESLKAERKKLEVGVSTSHDVLEFEEELADAQRRRILAALNYAKALVNLSVATGSLLEENDIVFEEPL